MNEFTDVLIVWYKKGERSAGILTQADFQDKLFPIFRDNLRPLNDTGKAILQSIFKDTSN